MTTTVTYTTQPTLYIISEFISAVSRDPKIAKKLSETLKYEMVVGDTVGSKVGVERSVHQQSLLKLMEMGVFVNLLSRIEKFPDKEQQTCWNQLFQTLYLYMETDLRNTSIYERSIYYKSKIFEKTSVLIDGAEKLGDYRIVLTLTYLIYGKFLQIAEDEYCRSTIRSQIQDGTLRKMAQLLSQHWEHRKNEEMSKLLSFFYTNIFLYMIMADRNTFYDKPCHNNSITAELRLIAPTLVKILGRKQESREDRLSTLRALTILEHYVVLSSDDVNYKFVKKYMVTKSLSDLLIRELRSVGNKNPSHTTELLQESYRVFCALETLLNIDHMRPLFPYLIKSMRQVDRRLTSEEELLLFASNDIACMMVKAYSGLEENFMSDILRMKLIPVWVRITQQYHTSSQDLHLTAITEIAHNMGKLVDMASHEHVLTMIDQVLPCFRFWVYYITDRTDLNLEAIPTPGFSMAKWLGKLFLTVVRRLAHDIYHNKLGCIDSQLDALLESGLVLGIGKALITFKDHQIMMDFLEASGGLFRAGDNRKVMKKLVVFLPKIIDRCKELLPQYRDDPNPKNILRALYYPVIRKAVAYAIEDISPTLFEEEQIAEKMLEWWEHLTWNLPNKRIEFPFQRKFAQPDEEHYYDGSLMADSLRATWAICQHYPDKVSEIVKLCDCGKLEDVYSRNMPKVKKFMKVLLDLVASYLNYSEEYSKDFLLHITAFVRDLDIDPMDEICGGISAACQRFLEIQCDQELVQNVYIFTKQVPNLRAT